MKNLLGISRGRYQRPSHEEVWLQLGCSLEDDDQLPFTADISEINFVLRRDLTLQLFTHNVEPAVLKSISRLSSSCHHLEFKADFLDLDVLVTCSPWNKDNDWQNLLRLGRRCVVLSPCGFTDSQWHDGPLAHVNARQEIVSYIPSGGSAELLIPCELDESIKGLPIDEVSSLEGAPGEKAHRVLIAALRAMYGDNPAQLMFKLDSLDLRTAVELTLIRQALPQTQLQVLTLQPLPPQWRRLLQNINIRHVVKTNDSIINMPQLVPSPLAQSIAGSINQLSDVLPSLMV